VAYGDFTYPKIKPSKTKPGDDADGYERGAKGVDREDNSEWFRSANPKGDYKLLYPGAQTAIAAKPKVLGK
jgi:hypothetical protein